MRSKTRQVALSIGALLAWAGLVALQVGAAFGFGGVGVVGLLLGTSLIGFFVSALVGIVTRRSRFTLYLGIALFALFLAFWTASFISQRQRLASIAAAQPIIAAAERYHMATGYYPRSLRDLVPVYLSTEPRTKMGFRGTPFMLSSRLDRFHLSFSLPAWMLCTYDSESKQWEIHD